MDSAIKLSTGISRGARIATCYLAYNEHRCTPSFIHDTPTYQVVVVMMVRITFNACRLAKETNPGRLTLRPMSKALALCFTKFIYSMSNGQVNNELGLTNA